MLREIFNRYATVERDGQQFMTAEDFVYRYLGLFDDGTDGDEGSKRKINTESIRLLAAIVDTNKDNLISYAEFQAFEGLLCLPDALYKTAFQLFDINGNGVISFSKYSFFLLMTV